MSDNNSIKGIIGTVISLGLILVSIIGAYQSSQPYDFEKDLKEKTGITLEKTDPNFTRPDDVDLSTKMDYLKTTFMGQLYLSILDTNFVHNLKNDTTDLTKISSLHIPILESEDESYNAAIINNSDYDCYLFTSIPPYKSLYVPAHDSAFYTTPIWLTYMHAYMGKNLVPVNKSFTYKEHKYFINALFATTGPLSKEIYNERIVVHRRKVIINAYTGDRNQQLYSNQRLIK